jgi:hypothetical protein
MSLRIRAANLRYPICVQARWRSWLRNCVTSQKVAGSIPHGLNIPSGRTVVLGLTKPLTEMITRNISWEANVLVCRADNLTTFICQLSWKLGASTSWNPHSLSKPVMGLLLLFFLDCSTLLNIRLIDFPKMSLTSNLYRARSATIVN